MPATCKADLTDVTIHEFDKLIALVSPLETSSAKRKDAVGISIKDIIAHRAHWIGLFLGWYRDGLAGKPVFFPAEGYKWNELPRYNSALRARQTDLTWPDALHQLESAHGALLQLIENLDDAALYGGPMKGANNTWTTGRWAEAAGPSHYRSAQKFVRQHLKALA